MKLHYCPQTRAFTALWMLEEVAEPYELVRVDIRAPSHPSAEYQRVNPMGKVPALEDGGVGFGETAAILLYLADKFPTTRLAPPASDPRRGRFLQWLMFSPAVLEPAATERRAGATPNSFSAGWGDYDRALGALERELQPGRWLVGDTFTAADLYIGSSLGFGMRFGLFDKRPRFEEFAQRAEARPAHQRALAIEAAQAR
jgi:glutathione S-transferase